MSLEGRIRDLGLHEVCQLLGIGRKTGTLELRAPLLGLHAEIRVLNGAVIGASSWRADRPRPESGAPADARGLAEVVQSLLVWTDGEFRFVSAEPSTMANTGLRLSMDPILVEAVRRAELWDGLRDRIPHAEVIPAFIDTDAQQLPLLRLAPPEWEVLTRVDGRRTLSELASALQRDLLEVAGTVHALIGAGLLVLRTAEAIRASHPTPPSAHGTIAVHSSDAPPVSAPGRQRDDLWIPDDDADSVYDPLATVAAHSSEPSLQEERRAASVAVVDPVALAREGDEAARHGAFLRAIELWSLAIADSSIGDDERARLTEVVTAARTLHERLRRGS